MGGPSPVCHVDKKGHHFKSSQAIFTGVVARKKRELSLTSLGGLRSATSKQRSLCNLGARDARFHLTDAWYCCSLSPLQLIGRASPPAEFVREIHRPGLIGSRHR